MTMPSNPPAVSESTVLMDQNGIRVSAEKVSTEYGDYPIASIQAVDQRVVKPMYGPLLLCLLGTINLAIAFETAFWLDLIASAVMLGAGILWRILGTKYVLTLKTDEGDQVVWFSRKAPPVQDAVAAVRQLLK